jgi:opacity protein-like surface antigen
MWGVVMRFRSGLVALVAFAALSAPALAADMPVKARPYVEPVVNWTGFYAGAFVGYHWGDITQAGCTGLCAVNPRLDGAVAGVQFGYDYEFANNMVLGAFGWIPVVAPRATINLGAPGLDFHEKPRFTAVGAVRLGMAMGMGKVLPYVFVGGGFVNNEIHSDVTNVTPSATHTAMVAGVGVEYRLARNWSVDARYMYGYVAKETYDFGGGPEQYGENSSNVLFAINYRF